MNGPLACSTHLIQHASLSAPCASRALVYPQPQPICTLGCLIIVHSLWCSLTGMLLLAFRCTKDAFWNTCLPYAIANYLMANLEPYEPEQGKVCINAAEGTYRERHLCHYPRNVVHAWAVPAVSMFS